MTSEERAAIEAEIRYEIAEGSHALVTLSALLDELRRVEQQRDRAMEMLIWVRDTENHLISTVDLWLAQLKTEIAGEKEKAPDRD